MTNMNRTSKTISIALLTLVSVSVVYATTGWNKTFKSYYKPSEDSALKSARCAVCHLKSSGKSGLNPYGKLLKGKEVSIESLKAIESVDADGDGVDNITEIKAGTLPGDAGSKP